jgi:uncharacterized membrane protein
MNWVFLVVLWIHALVAVFFIGGSFFIWLVVWPATLRISTDEQERAKILKHVGRIFGTATDVSVTILLLTGLYLGYEYLPTLSDLTSTEGGKILLAKGIVVVIMLVLMYANNLYHGKKIIRLVNAGKLDEVRRIRKITHLASLITLGLMIVIAILAFTLPFYHP